MGVSKFTYSGKVRGQARPRFTRNGHAYELAEDKHYKAELRRAYVEQGGEHYGNAPVSVAVFVYGALPASRPKAMQSEPNAYKPDADNIAKAVLDALQGVAYDDDKQVTRLLVSKADRKRGQSEGLRVYVRKAI